MKRTLNTTIMRVKNEKKISFLAFNPTPNDTNLEPK